MYPYASSNQPLSDSQRLSFHLHLPFSKLSSFEGGVLSSRSAYPESFNFDGDTPRSTKLRLHKNKTQQWSTLDEMQLFKKIVQACTSNFEVIAQMYQTRSRKQLENKWQSIKRKVESSGVLAEWKTLMFCTVKDMLVVCSQPKQNINNIVQRQILNLIEELEKNHYILNSMSLVDRIALKTRILNIFGVDNLYYLGHINDKQGKSAYTEKHNTETRRSVDPSSKSSPRSSNAWYDNIGNVLNTKFSPDGIASARSYPNLCLGSLGTFSGSFMGDQISGSAGGFIEQGNNQENLRSMQQQSCSRDPIELSTHDSSNKIKSPVQSSLDSAPETLFGMSGASPHGIQNVYPMINERKRQADAQPQEKVTSYDDIVDMLVQDFK